MNLFLIFISLVLYAVDAEKSRYDLEKVFILGRHNIRTPLSKTLAVVTKKQWPHWKEKSGYLTEKGALLEGYMGEFISAWLRKEWLLPEKCPSHKDFYMYANTKQRTLASAFAFVSKAFPNCNVTVHHSPDQSDPVFNPVIHNTTSTFKNLALKQMNEYIKKLELNNSYVDLEKILDYNNSALCQENGMCDLIKDKNKLFVKAGVKPNVFGPLKIGNSVLDAFLMENYEGLPKEDVAWGQMMDSISWKTMMSIHHSFHNVIFKTEIIARDICQPLLQYMAESFLNETSPKVILLMGHDANMFTLLASLKFKEFSLPKQYEITPVGGKIVFQRWIDNQSKQRLLKINYVYQSTDQLRNGSKLSLSNPAQMALLEIENCNVDVNGFCLWNNFVEIVKNIV